MSLRSRIGRLARWAGIVAIACLTMASAAQADGEWKIAEQTMTELEAPEASIFGTASEIFKLSVAYYASEIECSTLATEAPTKIFKGGTSEAILKLSSCKVLGVPFISETCKVLEPVTLKVKGKLLLHASKTYELFEAQTGKTSLGAVEFKAGTECPLPLSSELKGTFVGETETGERKEQPLTLSPTVESLFGGDSLSLNTHPATLKGKSVWALAAGYKGLKWAAEGKKSAEEEELEKEALEKEALAGPYWEIGGTPIIDKTLLPEFNAQKDSSHIIVLTKSGLSTLELDCTDIAFSKGLLYELGRLTGSINFTGCITRLAASEVPLCKPHSPTAAEGTITTEPLEGLLGLHKPEAGGTEDVLELLAVNAGMIFVSLELGSGKCAIKGANITGTIFLKENPNAKILENLAEHLFEEFKPLTKILFGANPMTIDGSFWVFLTGAHQGMKWSGHPA